MATSPHGVLISYHWNLKSKTQFTGFFRLLCEMWERWVFIWVYDETHHCESQPLWCHKGHKAPLLRLTTSPPAGCLLRPHFARLPSQIGRPTNHQRKKKKKPAANRGLIGLRRAGPAEPLQWQQGSEEDDTTGKLIDLSCLKLTRLQLLEVVSSFHLKVAGHRRSGARPVRCTLSLTFCAMQITRCSSWWALCEKCMMGKFDSPATVFFLTERKLSKILFFFKFKYNISLKCNIPAQRDNFPLRRQSGQGDVRTWSLPSLAPVAYAGTLISIKRRWWCGRGLAPF